MTIRGSTVARRRRESRRGAVATTARPNHTYDDRQLAAVLVRCQDCGRAYYMTVPRPICQACLAKVLTSVDTMLTGST